jgi:hypothetical protein
MYLRSRVFPHHTSMGESLARIKRSLGSGVHPEDPERNAAIGYYLVVPRGRTLRGGGTKDGEV